MVATDDARAIALWLTKHHDQVGMKARWCAASWTQRATWGVNKPVHVRMMCTGSASLRARRDRWRFVAPLGVLAGATAATVAMWWYLKPNRPQTPGVTQYAPLILEPGMMVPHIPELQFDVYEAPVHRHLRLVARAPLLIPEEVAPPHGAVDINDVRSRFSIYSYYIKEPSIQVERAYTPLRMLARADPLRLDFLVKRYADGEMSRYLHRVRLGSDVSLRGPEATWHLPKGRVPPREVVMVRVRRYVRSHRWWLARA